MCLVTQHFVLQCLNLKKQCCFNTEKTFHTMLYVTLKRLFLILSVSTCGFMRTCHLIFVISSFRIYVHFKACIKTSKFIIFNPPSQYCFCTVDTFILLVLLVPKKLWVYQLYMVSNHNQITPYSWMSIRRETQRATMIFFTFCLFVALFSFILH